MRVGCVGVGTMGGAVARRIATGHGFEVVVFDLSPTAVARCAASGARAAVSGAGAVENADVVLTSLPTPALVRETITELLPALTPNAIVVDVSTIDPVTARAVADLCGDAGHPFVACALGKSPAHAERGEIPLFVGGDREALARIRPLLQRMGERIFDFGTVEAATTFKLVSNLIGMTNVAALAEGLALADAAGIGHELFAEALAVTGGESAQTRMRLPWMLAGDWAPRFSVDLAAKDMRLGIGLAQQLNVPMPVVSEALTTIAATSDAGHGPDDVAAVAKMGERAVR